MRAFKIGVVADCFRLPIEQAVAKAAELGARGVQVYTVSGAMSPEQLDGAARRTFKDLCARHHVEISALCGDMGGGFRDAAANGQKVSRTKAIIDLAVDLGTSVITTHVGVIPSDVADKAYAVLQAACRQIAEYARGRGVTLAIETGPEKAAVLRRFLDDVDSPGLGVNFDPANLVMVTGDDPVAAVGLLGPRIVHTHAKDGRMNVPCDPHQIYHGGAPHPWSHYFTELPLGKGDVKWDAYLAALEQAGYKGFLTIEREVGDDPAADIASAIAFLRNKIGPPARAQRPAGPRAISDDNRGKETGMPVRIGVIGIGFMGSAHFNIHRANPAAQVVAICDVDKKKLSGDWSSIAGNVAVGGGKVDLAGIKTYENADDLIADPDIDVVDITLPTYLHAQYAIKAMQAGKHVFCEKPMARTSAEARKMLDVAKKTRRKLFIGQCIRFWPGWHEAREIVRSKKYGKVISATFRRLSQLPTWGWQNWLQDNAKSGLCALDMHIHDTDYVLYMFGKPKAVTSHYAGFKKNRIDHIVVAYDYGQGVLVTSEGGWEYKPAFGFTMGFIIHMEKATLTYQLETNKLMLDPASGPAEALPIVAEDGYIREMRHYVDCVINNKQSEICSPASAMETVALVEAEMKSALTGRKVAFKTKKG